MKSWYGTDSKAWVVIGVVASAGILSTGLIYMAQANAQPGCTASGLSNALGLVASQTGDWLDGHPEANDVITSVGGTGNEDAIRQYFVAHQSEWAELQGIASPLRNLRNSCNVDVAPAQIARLFDAMAS